MILYINLTLSGWWCMNKVRFGKKGIIFSIALSYCTAELLSCCGHLSSPVLIFFLIFVLFIYFFFWFLLTWDHNVQKEKIKTTSPLKVHNKLTPPNSCILLGRVSTKVFKRIVKSEIFRIFFIVVFGMLNMIV